MLLDRFPYEFLDVERPAFTGIERPEALVNLSPQLAKLLDVRQQTAANLLLIGGRQVRHFGDRLFEKFDHGKPYYPIGTGIKIQNGLTVRAMLDKDALWCPDGVRAVDVRMVRAAG